jgi:3-hydroxyacyl-[acyl-carrier-protein] dehydratase
MRKRRGNLVLGSAVIEYLIPQRRPFLMIDFVRHYSDEADPELEGGRHVTLNEDVFAGHFPGMPVWPGAFTMEGLGQACSILLLITLLRRRAVEAGRDPDSVLEALRNLDRGYRLHPGFRAEASQDFLEGLAAFRSLMAFGAAVDLKFVRPVQPGCRVDYHVRWTDQVGNLVRFAVDASVDGESVVTGTMTGARMERPMVFPP